MNLVSKLYDNIHFIFIQFVQSLSYLEQTEYPKLLPPNVDRILTVNYNLPPSYTLYIIRSSLKPIHRLTDEEFAQKVHLFKGILEMHMDQ